MQDGGEAVKGEIRPEFNRSVMIDFQGAKITSDAGVLMLREVDERFDIIGPIGESIDDSRSPRHTRHTIVQMIRQRVYQIASGYEDCNDADHLRIDPALRLAIGKDHDPGAGQSMLSRLENGIIGNDAGLASLDDALLRSSDVVLGNLDKRRLIIDLDSTENPAYGSQENVAYNGHFGKNCFHPLFCFTSEGTCLGSKLRPGNVHSADGAVDFIRPIVERYRSWFQLFWLRGEEVRRSMEWLIRRLIKVGAKVAYHARQWHVHITSAFPLASHYRAVFGYG